MDVPRGGQGWEDGRRQVSVLRKPELPSHLGSVQTSSSFSLILSIAQSLWYVWWGEVVAGVWGVGCGRPRPLSLSSLLHLQRVLLSGQGTGFDTVDPALIWRRRAAAEVGALMGRGRAGVRRDGEGTLLAPSLPPRSAATCPPPTGGLDGTVLAGVAATFPTVNIDVPALISRCPG
jgi:hypothetical protein